MFRTFGFLSTAAIVLVGFSGNVSADEYGERFYGRTPAGMAEYTAPSYEMPDIAMDDMASSLQDIMPAAGENSNETSEQEPEQAVDEEQDSTAE